MREPADLAQVDRRFGRPGQRVVLVHDLVCQGGLDQGGHGLGRGGAALYSVAALKMEQRTQPGVGGLHRPCFALLPHVCFRNGVVPFFGALGLGAVPVRVAGRVDNAVGLLAHPWAGAGVLPVRLVRGLRGGGHVVLPVHFGGELEGALAEGVCRCHQA